MHSELIIGIGLFIVTLIIWLVVYFLVMRKAKEHPLYKYLGADLLFALPVICAIGEGRLVYRYLTKPSEINVSQQHQIRSLAQQQQIQSQKQAPPQRTQTPERSQYANSGNLLSPSELKALRKREFPNPPTVLMPTFQPPEQSQANVSTVPMLTFQPPGQSQTNVPGTTSLTSERKVKIPELTKEVHSEIQNRLLTQTIPRQQIQEKKSSPNYADLPVFYSNKQEERESPYVKIPAHLLSK